VKHPDPVSSYPVWGETVMVEPLRAEVPRFTIKAPQAISTVDEPGVARSLDDMFRVLACGRDGSRLEIEHRWTFALAVVSFDQEDWGHPCEEGEAPQPSPPTGVDDAFSSREARHCLTFSPRDDEAVAVSAALVRAALDRSWMHAWLQASAVVEVELAVLNAQV